MKKDGFVKIYSTLSIAEAHTVKFLFENNGIDAVIENQEMNPFFGMVSARDAEAQVWVPEDKSEEASALLAKSSSLDLSNIRLVKCKQCGEMVCDMFDYCWNCTSDMKTGRPDRDRGPLQLEAADKQGRFPALLVLFLLIVLLVALGFIISRFFHAG